MKIPGCARHPRWRGPEGGLTAPRPPQPCAAGHFPCSQPGLNSDQHRVAHGERSGLVQNNDVEVRKALKASPPLKRTPSCAPRPTATVRRRARPGPWRRGRRSPAPRPCWPAPLQGMSGEDPEQKSESGECQAPTGTKMELARSASRSMGARELCACSTMRVICASTVASPRDCARQTTAPS